MNRLRLFATLSTLLLALVLTACGNNAEPSDPGAIPTVTGLPADQQQSQPETEPGTDEGYPSPDGEVAPEPPPVEEQGSPEDYPAPMELPSPTPFPPDYVAPTPSP